MFKSRINHTRKKAEFFMRDFRNVKVREAFDGTFYITHSTGKIKKVVDGLALCEAEIFIFIGVSSFDKALDLAQKEATKLLKVR